MRFCAGKTLAPSAKVGIPIQVTQSFWIIVPPVFVRTIEICFQTLLSTSLQLGMLLDGNINIFGRLLTLLTALLALLIALLALLIALLALLALLSCTRRCGQAWRCASFRPQTSHPSFLRSGFNSSRSGS